jgi:hypothetical protein
MNIPNIPSTKEPIGFVELNGNKLPVYMNDTWWNVFNELFMDMQKFLSNEGTGIPEQGDDNFTTLNNEKSKNTLLVKEGDGKLYFNLAGTYKEISLVP